MIPHFRVGQQGREEDPLPDFPGALRIGGGGRLICNHGHGDAGRPFWGKPRPFPPLYFPRYISRAVLDGRKQLEQAFPEQARILGLNRAVGDLIGLGAGGLLQSRTALGRIDGVFGYQLPPHDIGERYRSARIAAMASGPSVRQTSSGSFFPAGIKANRSEYPGFSRLAARVRPHAMPPRDPPCRRRGTGSVPAIGAIAVRTEVPSVLLPSGATVFVNPAWAMAITSI